MKPFVFTNKRGETVVPFELFKDLKPENIKGLPAKVHISRKQRRIRNGTVER